MWTDTRVIAVVMPNDNSVDNNWAKFRTSVAKIQKLTKYKFFENLPLETRKALLEEIDNEPIPSTSRATDEDD
jgi:endonuclease G, mitochondrial